jgi:hypothetical protein
MEIDELGVFSSDGPSQTRWQWHAFDKLIESDERFFLRLTNSLNFVMIPKRAISSTAEIDSLRELLQNVAQRPTGAFPVLPLESSDQPGNG